MNLFKHINNLLTEKVWRKEDKYVKETYDYEFIWGVKSWYDLSGADVCFHTINDIDIIYDKENEVYMLRVETAYPLGGYASQCEYLKECLEAFAKYMDDNGLSKNESYKLFMNNICISMRAKTIEELYTNFKIFVNGFCNQDIDMEEENEKYEEMSKL